jgi:site-specific DNA-methyltransferase (adenine-specific)
MIKPYYDREGITIYCGDCREILPELPKVDLVLTDPPYGINLNTDNSRFCGGTAGNIAKRGNGVGSANGEKIIGDDKPFDPTFLLMVSSNQIIWGWNHFADKLPQGTCLVWLKRYDEAFGSFLSDAEIAWMSRGYGVYCKRDLSNNSIANDRVHPTQKPVSLMVWCLNLIPDAQTILDPFMGSGTTLVAAKKLGRKCIGIEISEKYCEVSVKRLSQEVMAL